MYSPAKEDTVPGEQERYHKPSWFQQAGSTRTIPTILPKAQKSAVVCGGGLLNGPNDGKDHFPMSFTHTCGEKAGRPELLPPVCCHSKYVTSGLGQEHRSGLS
jgi:hypothetical protein